MNRLEALCRPLIDLVCEYRCFSKAGAPVAAETMRSDIRRALDDIRGRCEGDPVLRREFTRIERPLVFFIDYTIKEGAFPFSREWRELARDYSELSGDEKFFDLLSENLDDPEAADSLAVFYLLMGLGFDGSCRGNAEYVERRMKLCAARFPKGFDAREDALFAGAGKDAVRRRGVRSRKPAVLLALAAVFAACAFCCNFYVFRKETAEYRAALASAVAAARPAYASSADDSAENAVPFDGDEPESRKNP